MSTVIFDFDSTLIQCESLEEILAPKLTDPTIDAAIRDITRQGMEGSITFTQSLAKRLALASPTLYDVTNFGERATRLLSVGMEPLIRKLLERNVQVMIISGGLREAILPVAQFLGIDPEHVHAVRLQWHGDGTFAGIDENDPFSISKVMGAKTLADSWPRPRIAVGDGMTDYHLFQHGLVEHFICYTEHARREPVLSQQGVIEANGALALSKILEEQL